jgi:hypothetical protein
MAGRGRQLSLFAGQAAPYHLAVFDDRFAVYLHGSFFYGKAKRVGYLVIAAIPSVTPDQDVYEALRLERAEVLGIAAHNFQGGVQAYADTGELKEGGLFGAQLIETLLPCFRFKILNLSLHKIKGGLRQLFFRYTPGSVAEPP